ncbi:MAG: hypothetical protein ACHQNE_02970 [Candidatus Kapaibacterium sp.]
MKVQDQIAFYLTGRHNGSGLKPLDRNYRPALFARHADLTELRYDFPLVLNSDGSPDRAILSLSGLVDEAVEALRDDKDRDRIARHGYELERELRKELARHGGHSNGSTADFATLWNAAAAHLTVEDPLIENSAMRLWELFHTSEHDRSSTGELADVEFALPSRVVRHVWRVVQASKARAFHNKAGRLLVKLHGILGAEAAGSDRGRSPERLRANLAAQEGTSFATTFDFEAMSRILIQAKPGLALSDARRRRIQSLIEIIERQRFFPPLAGEAPPAPGRIVGDALQAHGFVYYRCADALQAYKECRREAIELLKALAIAELEVSGEYRETGNLVDDQSSAVDDLSSLVDEESSAADDRSSANGTPGHDKIFEEFGAGGLDAGLLAMLPEYLVAKHSSELSAEETLAINEALSTGLPIRILVQTDDLLEPAGIARAAASPTMLGMPERHLALASRSRQMLDTAIGLTDVFVLQSSASELFRLRDALLRGMSYNGPAFFSIFSGSTGHNGDVPAYLVAAAAVESRAFPTIVYDPSAGSDWATRLQLDHNPDAENPWPIHTFEYENEAHETRSEQLAFTLADFMAMDDRFREHFAIVSKSASAENEALTLVPESLAHQARAIVKSKEASPVPRDRGMLPTTVPYIALVDANGTLQRAIVNRRALEETRRSQSLWRSLQELGGIHNSHAERLVEQLKAQLAATPSIAHDAPAVQPIAAQVAVATDAASVEVTVSEVAESHGNEPYIETPRCTTCNECTQVNNKMFAYNGEKQAYIADATAGTFRQLVEAAEGCQVSIIHPGKPRNPKEPGLDELMVRAAQFN